MKCEKCGSSLTLKTRRSGIKEGYKFWVCSKYPECNYRISYEEARILSNIAEPKKQTFTDKLHKIDKIIRKPVIALNIVLIIFLISHKNERSKNSTENNYYKKTPPRITQNNKQKIITKHNTDINVTAVKVKNDSICIPVTLQYKKNTVNNVLILDTGATTTSISPNIAQKLGIDFSEAKEATTKLADGRTRKAYIIKIDRINVGSREIQNLEILITPREDNEETGLLGMNFLKEFPHIIDTKNETIKWL